jgi:hypothetical protein
MNENQTDILERLNAKYKAIDQNTTVHLEGLLWSNPITKFAGTKNNAAG